MVDGKAGGTDAPAKPKRTRKPKQIQVRVKRAFVPLDGGKMVPIGTELPMDEKQARQWEKVGIVEWVV